MRKIYFIMVLCLMILCANLIGCTNNLANQPSDIVDMTGIPSQSSAILEYKENETTPKDKPTSQLSFDSIDYEKDFKNKQIIRNTYIDILQGNSGFFLISEYINPKRYYDYDYVTLDDVQNYYFKSDGLTCETTQFTIVDMDGNGEPEVIIALSLSGCKIILYYENDEVFGLPVVGERSMNAIKKDGTYTASSSAFCTYFCKLQFSDSFWTEITFAYSDYDDIEFHGRFFIDSEQVSENEFLYLWEEFDKKEDAEWHTFSKDTIFEDFVIVWDDEQKR